MRTMKGEVLLNIPARRAWEMYRDNNIVSHINPGMISSSEYLQGDGGPGSLRVFRMGPELNGFEKESREKIEKVEEGRSVTYHAVGGELRKMYDPYRVTLSFYPLPGSEQERCIAEWKAEFEPLSPAVPLPEKARMAALAFLKSFDKVGV
ncbi:hypothetical protein Taro_025563 [Colocasia esculenta]|uniref:Bet v I/Major latex protein domain-containing protein n=1 Tax=Colocasia esculenta TaxID=4460 RepID=A0A843VGY5_COLES|nr:hypothetical protein [Colocasia esculenta]